MIEPTGYTALDLVGYTDKGTYAANVNYVKNDLVHYGGNIWRVLIDDTIGIMPAEGTNYTLFIGEPTNLVERIIAPLEDNPATVAYQTGRQIIYNDYLYEVIQDIAVGDILIAYEDDPTNANIRLSSPVETQVLALDGRLDTAEDDIDALQSDATDLRTYLNNVNRRTRKNITADITADHGAKLIAAAAEQDLAKYGYAIGDYFIGASGYQYNLGDMDPNYGGYNTNAVINTHHIGIVVDTKENTPWLSTGTVTNYSSSTLHSYLTNTALPKIKSDFKTLFGGSTGTEHLLTRTELDNSLGGWGTSWTGLANCLICALTEVQVYGSRIFGADGNQTGTGSKHLEIFRKFRFNEILGNAWFWLRSLLSASSACNARSDGYGGNSGVSEANRAVGLILFH